MKSIYNEINIFLKILLFFKIILFVEYKEIKCTNILLQRKLIFKYNYYNPLTYLFCLLIGILTLPFMFYNWIRYCKEEIFNKKIEINGKIN